MCCLNVSVSSDYFLISSGLKSTSPFIFSHWWELKNASRVKTLEFLAPRKRQGSMTICVDLWGVISESVMVIHSLS